MKLSLVVAQGNPPGKEIPIRLPQFLIGRDPDCHLRPASPLVSKRHCALLVREGRAFVRDFNSTNGTFVNQEPVKGEREIQDGDELKMGPLLFKIKLTEAPSSSDTLSEKVEATLTDTQATLSASDAAAKTETMPAAPKAKGSSAKMPALPADAPAKPKGSSAKMPALSAEAPAKPAPKPAPKPAKSAASTEEDDIAAMLFNLEGDETSSATQDQIPQGTTVMEALSAEALAEVDAAAAAAEAESDIYSGGDKKNPTKQKIQDQKATADAAKSILDQYLRRSRS
ncbi:MAG TPA: FHA domain-containing protein [Gemmatales bacterium]|nr:FHA domain-containing protein [Gemmatales bacterium]HMP60734.1 FHA domain-containing protein [Gemmatales bacterium]